jgi:hypothetical protein
MRNQVNRFDGARHDANAREAGYSLITDRQVIKPSTFALFGALLVIALLVFACKAHADDTQAKPVPYWNVPKAEFVFDGLLAADMLTTLNGQKRGYNEDNPLLGQHPNTFETVAFFAGVGLLHAAITDRLPERWVPLWEALSIGVEGVAVGHNIRIGLRFSL